MKFMVDLGVTLDNLSVFILMMINLEFSTEQIFSTIEGDLIFDGLMFFQNKFWLILQFPKFLIFQIR